MQSPEAVISNCQKLIDFGAWSRGHIDPVGWLANFAAGHDKDLAACMLSRFMFYSDILTNQLLKGAFNSISNLLLHRPLAERSISWQEFQNSVMISIIHGEDTNPSDSGYLFARKARQVLGVDEAALVTPRDAMKAVDQGFSGPIVFIDDFTGSGDQFKSTWDRRYTYAPGKRRAFRSLPAAKHNIYLCTTLMTQASIERFARECPAVKVVCGNIIPRSYSFVSPDSIMWPPEVTDGPAFIERVSSNLGYQDDSGGDRDWRGYDKLGLGLAFEHSVPDATLPIFRHSGKGWRPLVRRT